MKLIYENELGSCVMHGGGGKGFCITELSGLGFPECTEAHYTYAGIPGQVTGEIHPLARTITIKVDAGSGMDKQEIYRAAKIFHKAGILSLHHENRHRAISCRCVSFVKKERKEPIVSFVVQLVADNPYFHDLTKQQVQIMEQKNLISSPFFLPAVFSSRTVRGTAIVSGDVEAEPHITLFGLEDCPEDVTGIRLKNETTGAEISLSYGISAGETIVIDIGARTITSDKCENMYPYLSGDSFLNQFTLCAGANVISCHTDVPISAILSFENSYVEAMY